jgi:hypothetical protein
MNDLWHDGSGHAYRLVNPQLVSYWRQREVLNEKTGKLVTEDYLLQFTVVTAQFVK